MNSLTVYSYFSLDISGMASERTGEYRWVFGAITGASWTYIAVAGGFDDKSRQGIVSASTRYTYGGRAIPICARISETCSSVRPSTSRQFCGIICMILMMRRHDIPTLFMIVSQAQGASGNSISSWMVLVAHQDTVISLLTWDRAPLIYDNTRSHQYCTQRVEGVWLYNSNH